MHFELDGAGLIPSEEDQPHHPPQPVFDLHDAAPLNKNLLNARSNLVLSFSRSDPHLNLTQLFHHHDEQNLPIVVSGLLDAPTAASVPQHVHLMNNSNNTAYNPLLSSLKGPGLNNSASSAALLDPAYPNKGAPLRKSSSAVDWSLLADIGKDHSPFHHLAERPGAVFEGGQKRHSHHFGFPALALLGDPAGGLVMSAGTGANISVDHKPNTGMFAPSSSSHSSQGSSSLVAAASAALHGSPNTMGGALAHSNPSSSSNPLIPSSSSSETSSLSKSEHSAVSPPPEHNHGMLGSVFKSGFLGRPVLRTDEESYRYLMALDR